MLCVKQKAWSLGVCRKQHWSEGRGFFPQSRCFGNSSLNCPDYSPTRQNYMPMIVSFAWKQRLEAAQTIKWKLRFRFRLSKQGSYESWSPKKRSTLYELWTKKTWNDYAAMKHLPINISSAFALSGHWCSRNLNEKKIFIVSVATKNVLVLLKKNTLSTRKNYLGTDRLLRPGGGEGREGLEGGTIF